MASEKTDQRKTHTHYPKHVNNLNLKGVSQCLIAYHQTLNDAEVVVDDLSERSQAVGCAGGVAMEMEQDKHVAHMMTHRHSVRCRSLRLGCRYSPDDLHGVVVLLVVHAHHEHGSVGTGGRDHHPLGAALQVSLGINGRNIKRILSIAGSNTTNKTVQRLLEVTHRGLLDGGEHTGGLHDVVNARIAPLDVGGVPPAGG